MIPQNISDTKALDSFTDQLLAKQIHLKKFEQDFINFQKSEDNQVNRQNMSLLARFMLWTQENIGLPVVGSLADDYIWLQAKKADYCRKDDATYALNSYSNNAIKIEGIHKKTQSFVEKLNASRDEKGSDKGMQI